MGIGDGAAGMIIPFLRLMVFGFIALSVMYLLIALYARSVEKERLEKEFDAGGIDGDREAYIAAGLAAYKGSLRRKLLWGVYIVPMTVITVLIYVLNVQ
jgi:hypothetical protein